MISLRETKGFVPMFSATGCFLENNGRFLVLRRSDSESQANAWGVPGGGIEKGETVPDATLREIREETGISMQHDSLSYWGKVYIRNSDGDFVYHMSSARFPAGSAIRLDPKEHKEYRWVTAEEALSLPLIRDMGPCIKLFYKMAGKHNNMTQE
jgi:8-oxo-dGTP pyrophosphatase MutT (NUDIX family)